MNEERTWLADIEWWISAFAALMAVLIVTRLVAASSQLAPGGPSNTVAVGLADRFAVEFLWPVWILVAFGPFLLTAAIGFRLLVPIVRGASPRVVGVVVVTWPLVLGAALLTGDAISSALFAAVGIAWGLAMPLPKQALAANHRVRNGVMVGLAFAPFAPWEGLLPAILWCVWRLRRKPAESAATAAGAAILPAVYLVAELPSAADPGSVATVILEVLMLAGISAAGVWTWRRQREADSEAGADVASVEAGGPERADT